MRAGDTAWIALGERPWPGATSGTLMSHTTTTIGATEFHEVVTAAEYAAANATLRVARDGGAPMPSMATVRGAYPTLGWRRGLSGGIAPSFMRTPTSAQGAPRG